MAKTKRQHFLSGTDPDAYAPDGFLASGWRVVRRGGRVKFGGHWFQPSSDEDRRLMEARIGFQCHCEITDPFGGYLVCAPPTFSVWEIQLAYKFDQLALLKLSPKTKAGDICTFCGKPTHPDEAACIHCGAIKPWAAADNADQAHRDTEE